MSPYFLCYECRSVTQSQPDTDKCPACSSSKGRMITDEEFKQDKDIGAIRMIDPRTGKPFKKGK